MRSQSTFHASKMVVMSFTLASLAGAALLKLPVAAQGASLSWIDAVFMATSAVCVTGLSVLDVGADLTRFGQWVLLALIQLGGLGIMTFAVLFLLLFRGRISMTSRLSVGMAPHKELMRNLWSVLFFVILVVFSCEAVGGVLLFLRFRQMHGMEEALFSSLFHAVSAFCNAGFSLYSDSLVRFQGEAFLPFVFMSLIVLGGLGFMVIDEFRAWVTSILQRRRFRMSLHTRVCLVGTVSLVMLGAAVVWLLERGNLLSGMSGIQQGIHALFLSVTARTAGFNTLETGSLTNATLFFVIFLMFIGGCAGSTAGGIKVTTLAVLLALVQGQIQGRSMTSLFRRKIPDAVVGRALAVFAAGFVVVSLAALLFQMTEWMGVSHQAVPDSFLDLLFESVSAFGTVGLSTGVTPFLSGAGKALAVVLMMVGRVGPLTLGLAMMTHRRSGPAFEYVEEEVVIG